MSHPALEFPVYGLVDGPDGPRWLDWVEGPLGHHADGIWLGHGSTPRDATRPWVHVGTFRRAERTEADAVERAALRAVLCVVDATMPDPHGRPHDYGHRLLDVASSRVGDHPRWRRVSWVVDGQSVTASTFDWAGAWAAFTTALPDVDIVAFGFGVAPAGLHLAEVQDGSRYHVDLGRPITFPDTVDQARAAAGVRSDPPGAHDWWPTHPDHDAVPGR